MITIPFQVSATEYSVYIGLGDDNIERVRQYDPAEVVLSQLGEPFQRLKLKDIVVGYCSEDDFKKVGDLPCGTDERWNEEGATVSHTRL
jgi:hypothetical protein